MCPPTHPERYTKYGKDDKSNKHVQVVFYSGNTILFDPEQLTKNDHSISQPQVFLVSVLTIDWKVSIHHYQQNQINNSVSNFHSQIETK